ncbi:MAG: hypothetical protein LiPW15_399 [Parcubacteria group bacterium LiPW_15]|nr:MAG: hypothetical protein LiPW15_399 [Parcubacteria group bacterium LiPW_15]
MSENSKGFLGKSLRSVSEEIRTWPWWLRNDGPGIGKETAPWQGEIPPHIISLLLENVTCLNLNGVSAEDMSSATITQHFKDCGVCRIRLVSTIERLQYFHYLVS